MVINGEETSKYGQGIFKMRKKKLIGFDNQAESRKGAPWRQMGKKLRNLFQSRG